MEWIFRNQVINNKKRLALGRSDYYISFIEFLEHKYNACFYQSDFLTIPQNSNRKSGFFSYFIETADEIHFSLRGVSVEDLKKILDKDEHPSTMTLWEIKFIFNQDYLYKTTWYTDDKLVMLYLQSLNNLSIKYYHDTSRARSKSENAHYMYDDFVEELEVVHDI